MYGDVCACKRARVLLCACVGDVCGDAVFAVHDLGEGLTVVGLLEGRVTTHQHEENHTQAPDICRGPERERETETETERERQRKREKERERERERKGE